MADTSKTRRRSERPNKEDYDFNDEFETLRFANDMIRFVDYLENLIEELCLTKH